MEGRKKLQKVVNTFQHESANHFLHFYCWKWILSSCRIFKSSWGHQVETQLPKIRSQTSKHLTAQESRVFLGWDFCQNCACQSQRHGKRLYNSSFESLLRLWDERTRASSCWVQFEIILDVLSSFIKLSFSKCPSLCKAVLYIPQPMINFKAESATS